MKLDPEAAQIVFDAPVKVVMIPLDVTHTAIFTPELHRHLLVPSTYPLPYPPPNPGSTPASLPNSGSIPSSTSALPPLLPLPSPQTPLRNSLSKILTHFTQSYKSVFEPFFNEGPPVHDPLTVFYVLACGDGAGDGDEEGDPKLDDISKYGNGSSMKAGSNSKKISLWKGARWRVDVELERGGRSRGMTVVDWWGYEGKGKGKHDGEDESASDESKVEKGEEGEGWGKDGRNVWVASWVDVEAFWKAFFDCVERADKVAAINDRKK